MSARQLPATQRGRSTGALGPGSECTPAAETVVTESATITTHNIRMLLGKEEEGRMARL